MSTEHADNRDAIAQKVRRSLHTAEKKAERLRKTNTLLLVAGLFCSAGATLVAGVTAVTGPRVGLGVAGWRIACIVAAVFGFLSTLSMGLNQRLRFGQRLSKVTRCVGKLRSLDLLIVSGDKELPEIIRQYARIVETYPDFTQ